MTTESVEDGAAASPYDSSRGKAMLSLDTYEQMIYTENSSSVH
jgi:hypothetical protein